MTNIGLAEIQKNIGIITSLKGPIKIVDMKRKISIAIIYPIKKQFTSISLLAGKYKNKVPLHLRQTSLNKAKEITLSRELANKYGLGIK